MNRFFVGRNNIIQSEKRILIDDIEDIKHIKKVLRLKTGDNIEISDGDCKDYICRIHNIKNNFIECRIEEELPSKGEPPVKVVLFQGLPKANKMDLIIQKCVEIGIYKIFPLITARTVVKINDVKSEINKSKRWEKISLEAAKQSKRGIIPKVEKIIEFKDLKEYIKDLDLVILPYEKEDSFSLKDVIKSKPDAKNIGIIIGPEGGFEEEEIGQAQDMDIKIVTLGSRILRTETAGLVTSSIVLYELGDLGGK